MEYAANGVAIKTGTWTDEEDSLLLQHQQKFGNKWSKVAEHIPGRTGQQCAQRWRHKVNPNIKKDKWTEEEDERLRRLVEKHGNKWAEIARHMDGRTDQQCMGRWTRHLDPRICRDTWRADEDRLLVDLYNKYGSQWSRISKQIQGRTSQQCRQRFCQLNPDAAAGINAAAAAAAAGGPGAAALVATGNPPGAAAAAARTAKRKAHENLDDDEDEDWAMEQRAFENYRSGAARRAEKSRLREASEKEKEEAKIKEEEALNPKPPSHPPSKKANRSHAAAAAAAAGAAAAAARSAAAGDASDAAGASMQDDPLVPMVRGDSTAPGTDLIRGLFSPEPPHHEDSQDREPSHLLHRGGSGNVLDGAARTPAVLTSAQLQASQVPGSEAPQSAWKLTPTAGVFSPGFAMATGFELPTPVTIMRKLGAVGRGGPGGSDGTTLELPFYPLEPLGFSPGSLGLGLAGLMDTPGILMASKPPSRLPTEAPGAMAAAPPGARKSGGAPALGLLPSVAAAAQHGLAAAAAAAAMGPPGSILKGRASSPVDLDLDEVMEGIEAAATAEPPLASTSGAGAAGAAAPAAHARGAAGRSVHFREPQGRAHEAGGEPSGPAQALRALPDLLPDPMSPGGTFLSPTPARARPPVALGGRGAIAAQEDPWTPSGALQPSSVRPHAASRLGQDSAAPPTASQTAMPPPNSGIHVAMSGTRPPLVGPPAVAQAAPIALPGGPLQATLCQLPLGAGGAAGKENRAGPEVAAAEALLRAQQLPNVAAAAKEGGLAHMRQLVFSWLDEDS